MIVCRRAAPAVVLLATTLGLVACTSSAEPGSSTSASTAGGSAAPTGSSSPTTSAATTSAATTSAPTTSAPAALGRVDGSYVLAGRSDDAARLYRVVDGGLRLVGPATDVTGVTAARGLVVVGRDTADAETVEQLRDGRPAGLGIRSGFGPALSRRGVLAYASLTAGTTPGIAKPAGTAIRVRSAPAGPDRTLATFTGSVSAPVWAGDDLVVAVIGADSADGTTARLVRFVDGRGPARSLGTVPRADALELTGGPAAVTVATDDGATIVTTGGARTTAFARGWQPLCWTAAGTVLASRGSRLGLVPVGSAGAGTPVDIGDLGEGRRAFAATCAT